MSMDGLSLYSAMNELNKRLAGGKIDKIQQTDKEELLLMVRSLGQTYRLLINASASDNRVQLTELKKQAPSEAPMFCMLLRKRIAGGKIVRFEQERLDRVLKISIETYNDLGDLSVFALYCELMGKHSNIILVNEKGVIVDAIKHVGLGMSSVRFVMPGLEYSAPPAQDKQDPSKASADDFSMAIPGLSRFRVNTYRQRGSLAAVIRIIAFNLPDPQDLHIPPAVMEAADLTKGMVLITGPAGSGKSTTMACIIDKINHSREGHIITLEDPLEYLHRHDKCIVSQREICTDTANYLVSLRATLRQSPDVILLGEMRDHETIQTAMTAAETGHLILSSLHTTGAANTISRIMDVFEPSQQHQIAIQLSMVLQTVISQQLVPDVNGHNIPVFEIMRLTPAIRNMIRDNKIYQIDGVIASSSQADMKSMDNSLLELYRNRQITKETALKYSSNPEMLKRKLL